MRTPVAGPRRSDATRDRALVLETARTQLDRDVELPGMKDLARLAGIGVGTVYRPLPSPQALLAELGTEASRRVVDGLRRTREDER